MPLLTAPLVHHCSVLKKICNVAQRRALTSPVSVKKYHDYSSSLVTRSLCPTAPPRRAQPAAVFCQLDNTAGRHVVPVQICNRRKPAGSDIYSSESASRPHSAPIALQMLHHQLLLRSVESFTSVLAASVQLPFSHVDDGPPRRSVHFCWQLVLPLERLVHELQKLSIPRDC